MGLTTIPARDHDHERFVQAKITYQHEIGREITHLDFFAVVMDHYEGKKKRF